MRNTLLDRFYSKGWLSSATYKSQWHWINAEARLRAGKRLAQDYYLGYPTGCRAIDLEKIRVDGGFNKPASETQNIHQDYFIKAIRIIPEEFIGVVWRVVLEDRNVLHKKQNTRSQGYENHDIKRDLCRGLDRLVIHYEKKNG